MARLVVPLLNKSLHSSTFLTLWKRAIVSPVQKSSQSSDLTNFRPISVLPLLSKLLERVVYLLICCLSTSLAGYSTQDIDVLLLVMESWRKAIDEGMYTGGIFLDLAKA